MSKLQLLVVIASVLVLAAETVHHVRARPGPPALDAAETVNLSRQLLSTEPVESGPEGVSLSIKDAEEMDLEEELDAVCIENESCDERRLLVDSIDYRVVGPDYPITDPPATP